MTAATDIDLLRRLHTVGHAFLVATLASVPGESLGVGVAIAVIHTDPLTLALEVDGVVVAERPGDAELGPLVAQILERGLAQLSPAARLRAATLLQRRHARVSLAIPLGQDVASAHGLWSRVDGDAARTPVELFRLVAADAPLTVH